MQIRLRAVTKRFGNLVAVDDVSLDIQSGELFFLLGPSGCGKTTCLRMVAGFFAPERGSIHFGERDVTRVPPNRRNTGMVFQNYALWPHMTVRKNVAYGLDVRRVPRADRDRRVLAALELVRMAEKADRYPNQLSGGEQQRVALARALVIEPEVLLLDEPLSNLDAKLRHEMRGEIRRIHDQLGLTAIYVTHDQKEALSIADRLAVMRAGKLEQVGAPREVYANPANGFIATFLGEANLIPGKYTRNGSHAKLVTPFGELPTSRTAGFNDGEAVLACIRPEAWGFVTEGGFAGRIETVTYLGEQEQFAVRIGEQLVRTTTLQSSLVRRVGDLVRLAVAPENVAALRE